MKVIEPPSRQVGTWNHIVVVDDDGYELGYLEWRYEADANRERYVQGGILWVDGVDACAALEAKNPLVAPVAARLFAYAMQKFREFQSAGDTRWEPGEDAYGNPGERFISGRMRTESVVFSMLPFAKGAVQTMRPGGVLPPGLDGAVDRSEARKRTP
jgi:hypothetical protein